MVKVSVVIPVKNRSFELKRALSSILRQTEQDFEILVVDDHSEENVQDVVNSFNDNRIKYFKSYKIPGNANVSRNIGFDNAAGTYIAMLDSDDEWLPEHLEKKIKFLEETGADGVFGSIIIDDGENSEIINSRDIKRGESMINYLLSGGWAPTPTHVYKTAAAKSVKWDEELLRNQDLDFSVRFAAQYKFMPSKDATCIVHWRKNEKRTEHLESQKKFLIKHGNKIRQDIYCQYHAEIYRRIRDRKDIQMEILRYFKNESVRYPNTISLNFYLEIMAQGKSAAGRLFLRFAYIVRILFNIS